MAFQILLPLLINVVLADNCQNPMFADPIFLPGGSNVTLTLLPSPQNQISFGSCSELDGKPSCCNATTWVPIQQDLTVFDEMFQIVITTLKGLTPEEIVNAVLFQMGWTLNPQQFPLAVQMAEEFKKIIDPSTQCMGGFLGYFQGMLCFSCYPNWSNYFDSITLSLLLTQKTCDGVYNDCNWFWQEWQEALLIWIDLLIQILSLDTYHDFSSDIAILREVLNALKETSYCRLEGYSDCQEYTCIGLMHGLIIGAVPNTENSNLNTNTNKYAISKTFAQYMPSNFTKLGLKTIGMVQNQYASSGGFDAFSIGCNSKGSTYACPSPYNPDSSSGMSNSTKTFLAVGLPIILLTIIGVIVFCIYKNRKPDHAVSLDDNVHYARLPNERGQIHDGDSHDVAFEPPVVPVQTSTDGAIQ